MFEKIKNKIKIYITVTIKIKLKSSLSSFIQKDTRKNIKATKNFSFKNRKYEINL